MSSLKCPVFIIHGTEDQDIPFFHGECLGHELQYPWPPWYPEAGHNDIEEKFRKVYLSKLKQFLATVNEIQSFGDDKPHDTIMTMNEAKLITHDLNESCTKMIYDKIVPMNLQNNKD